MSNNVTRRRAMGLVAAASTSLCQPVIARPSPVDETGLTPIGGIEQWIGINGEDRRNPAILYLHGGPGEAQSPLLRMFEAWHHDFTVVNWDQRGAGRTFGRNGAATPGMSTPEMALETLVGDAREVAQYACQRLSKQKLILVGQSWGSVLGLHVIRRWPDLFAAFVATGFAGSWKDALEGQERWARSQAAAKGDKATLEALDAAAALPVSDMKRITAPRAYVMSANDLEYLKRQGEMVGLSAQPPQGEAAEWLAGVQFSIGKLLPVVVSADARQLGPDMPVPFFVIQGSDDHIVSLESARTYVADVHAPSKAFIAIPGGHYACFTSATEFAAALRKAVRHLAA